MLYYSALINLYSCKTLTNKIAIIIISNFEMKNFNGDDFFWDYHVVSCIKSNKSKARQKTWIFFANTSYFNCIGGRTPK